MPTWNLLEHFTKNGLEKFIYFSTIHVYGNLPKETITEDYQLQPLNTYGLTHLLSENICNYYNDKTETDCINVRLSNSYGSPVFKENNCWWLVINDLCKTAIENSEIRLQSDGSPQRDFIHGDDIAHACEKILINNTYGKKLILSGNKPTTINQLISILEQINPSIQVSYSKELARENDYQGDIGNLEETYSLLNWRPSIDLSQGINKLKIHFCKSKNRFEHPASFSSFHPTHSGPGHAQQ